MLGICCGFVKISEAEVITLLGAGTYNTRQTVTSGNILKNIDGASISFEGCSAPPSGGNGGAIFVNGGTVEFTGDGAEFKFEKNDATAQGKGGAIYVNNNGAVTMRGNKIVFEGKYAGGVPKNEDNTAFHGAAIYMDNNADSMKLSVDPAGEIVFGKNQAINDGGAVCIYGGTVIFDGNLRFEDNLNRENNRGGAIFLYTTSGTLTLKGNVTFERNHAAGFGGAIYASNVSRLTYNLATAGNRVIFPDNLSGVVDEKTNGILNDGTIEISGVPGSSFELGKNIFFRSVGSQSILTLEGGVELILLGTITQNSINFGALDNSDPLLTIVIDSFDSNTSGDSRTARGGSGGYLNAIGSGSTTITGKSAVRPRLVFDETYIETLGTGIVSREYKYIYNFNNLDSSFLDNNGDIICSSSSYNAGLKSSEDGTIEKGIFNIEFNPSAYKSKDECQSGSGAGKSSENEPDSHIASQAEATMMPVQQLSDVIADRLFAMKEEESSSFSSTSELLIAAVGKNNLAYGLAKDRDNSRYLLSKVWSQFSGSFGSQKLQENMKTSGFGFMLGYDYRVRDDLRAGVVYNYSSNSSKGDSRNVSESLHGFSLYGDYDFRNVEKIGNLIRGISPKDLYLSALLTFGPTSGKNNGFSGDGSIFYLSPRVGYKFAMKNLEGKVKNLKNIILVPELGLRYFRVHHNEQEGEYSKASAVTRNILTIAPTLRFSGLFREKFELGAKFGFGFDVYSGGDSSYTVTPRDGSSYQLMDSSDNTRVAVELGLNVGYCLPHNTRISLGYSGRYSSNIGSSTLSLGGSFRF